MDGLDQPSTAGAAAALPGGGGTIRQPAPRRRGRAATSLGEGERGGNMRMQTCASLPAAHTVRLAVRPAPSLRAADAALWRKARPQSVTTWF